LHLRSALARQSVELGATVELKGRQGYPPFTIAAAAGGRTTIECETTNIVRLLLACSIASGDSHIEVPLLHEKPYVGITLSWLDKQGIRYRNSEDLQHFDVPGGQEYKPFDELITGDFSSASFFFCAAAICGTTVTVEGLDQQDPQGDKRILDILDRMGCTVRWHGKSVSVTGPADGRLSGGTFHLNSKPDALPILAVTACFADSQVRIVNVPQARIKENRQNRRDAYQSGYARGDYFRNSRTRLTIEGGHGLAGGIRSTGSMTIGSLWRWP
jgi:3-phosphoshikimate 1-carboxyvinyltransferase